jgi:uncharacterized cupredoxin-like copper-binding protein
MRKILALAAAALLAGCASSYAIEPQLAPSSVDFAGSARQQVALSNFDFTPREIRLRAGQPYELVLTNTSSGGHDFAAPEFFAAAQVMPADAESIADGQVEVAPGSTQTVRLVPAAGEYDLVCTHTGHALLGMHGKIVVE